MSYYIRESHSGFVIKEYNGSEQGYEMTICPDKAKQFKTREEAVEFIQQLPKYTSYYIQKLETER